MDNKSDTHHCLQWRKRENKIFFEQNFIPKNKICSWLSCKEKCRSLEKKKGGTYVVIANLANRTINIKLSRPYVLNTKGSNVLDPRAIA